MTPIKWPKINGENWGFDPYFIGVIVITYNPLYIW